MLLNFTRLDNIKVSTLPYFTVEVFESLLVIGRDDEMTYKKALTGRSSEGFLFSCPRTANLFDNVGIQLLIAFSKSGALKLSSVRSLFSTN